MRKLYEINEDIERCIQNGIDEDTGEFTAFDELSALQMERDAKLEGVALYIKDARAEATAIKAEMDALKKRMEKLIRKADGAEEWLATNLNGQKFSTPRVECTFRKSDGVELDDEFAEWATMHPDLNLIDVQMKVVPKKSEIKKLLKQGIILEHCRLDVRQNIQVR